MSKSLPRQFIKQNSRDKHDFNDKYIAAWGRRDNCPIPKKKAVFVRNYNGHKVFWVDIEFKRWGK